MFTTAITNETTTTNGAVTHKSSLSACLDLFSMGVSAPNKEHLIEIALDEDIVVATQVVFHLRDCRNGQGNKDIARAYHNVVNRKLVHDDKFFLPYTALIPKLPEIGSWKDVFSLYGLNDQLDTALLVITAEAIYKDKLAAKWFPRQSALHKDVANYLDKSIGEVRRHVASFSTTVEQQMTQKKWHEIEYSHVPSMANKKYATAFIRNDASRYQEFLDNVMSSKTTIKSSVLYPHEIVGMCRNHGRFSNNSTANALWKDLPNYMTEASNVLPVIDVSASMTWENVTGNYKPLDIALGLGLYFATRNTGSYKNVWCNFSTTPHFYNLKEGTLYDNLASMNWSNWSQSTNIEAVFDKILEYSDESDTPKAVLIVSDMEFNRASSGRTNFKTIKAKYKAAGIPMPTLIFWRVNTALTQQPVTMHESGSILINGYSPSIMKTIAAMDIEELKNITPINMMYKAIAPYNYVKETFEQE